MALDKRKQAVCSYHELIPIYGDELATVRWCIKCGAVRVDNDETRETIRGLQLPQTARA
jgi:hypothetical protein